MIKRPESMEECIYYTNRDIGKNGSAICWVFKEKCPKCKKGLMAKPRDEKTGKPKIRAKEYVCPSCGYSVEKVEYESSLMANVDYTCPHCEEEGEIQAPFKRKNIKGISTLRVQCKSCGKDIDITKKMKEKKSDEDIEDDD
jgi:predicted RNA-binding Zn-ribbon protein involved in translation (DUF1610 family)